MAAHLLHHALNQCPPFFCKDHIYETGVFVILDHCNMAGPFQTPAEHGAVSFCNMETPAQLSQVYLSVRQKEMIEHPSLFRGNAEGPALFLHTFPDKPVHLAKLLKPLILKINKRHKEPSSPFS